MPCGYINGARPDCALDPPLDVIIIFISRLPEKHRTIELHTTENTKTAGRKVLKKQKVKNMKNTTITTRPKPNNYTAINHINHKIKNHRI